MDKKCINCGIILDIPCPNPVCKGHQNESVDAICRYCATNQRDELSYMRDFPGLFFSGLGDLAVDWEEV